MARAQEITAQIGSLIELREIIAAIRAMAAVQMQQGQRSLDAVRCYTEIIRNALAEAAALVTQDGEDLTTRVVPRPGLVVFCAEHGFCGAFNEPLIRAAADSSRTEPNLLLIFVGTRGAQRASEHGLRPHLTLPMATHIGGVSAVARRVASELLASLATSSVEVLYVREVTGQAATVRRLRLFPLEAAAVANSRAESFPLVNMRPQRLRDEIAAEYKFAMLEAAAMESFASENAARFRTMEAAHENIDKKSTELSRLGRRVRQEAITAEILEIISGAEAMKRK